MLKRFFFPFYFAVNFFLGCVFRRELQAKTSSTFSFSFSGSRLKKARLVLGGISSIVDVVTSFPELEETHLLYFTCSLRALFIT